MRNSTDKSVILALGSNKAFTLNGEVLSPFAILEKACDLLSAKLKNIEKSSVYKTKPMYVEDQEWFFNMVISCEWHGDNPQELLAFTQSVEKELGRDRSKEFRNGPRSLDVDIVLFSDVVVNTDVLQIPHPRMEERAFVLVPMLEIFGKHADTRTGYFQNCLDLLNSDDIELFTQ